MSPVTEDFRALLMHQPGRPSSRAADSSTHGTVSALRYTSRFGDCSWGTGSLKGSPSLPSQLRGQQVSHLQDGGEIAIVDLLTPQEKSKWDVKVVRNDCAKNSFYLCTVVQAHSLVMTSAPVFSPGPDSPSWTDKNSSSLSCRIPSAFQMNTRLCCFTK